MLKILIVDDEYLIREGLAESIAWGNLGFEVLGTASNGKDALAFLKSNRIDIVITDVKMPIMDGVTLCSIVNKKYPKTKIIILSGYNEFEYAQKAIEYNVCSYILKPLNENELITACTNIYNELQAENKINETSDGKGESVNQNEEEIKHTFLELINGKPEDEHVFLNNLKKSGFDLDGKIFKVIAFNSNIVNEISANKDLLKGLLQSSQKYWGKLNFPVIFLNSIFYVIAHSKNHISKIDMKYYSKEFVHYIESNTINDYGKISVGIGSQCQKLSSLKNSADEANIALNKKYYRGEGSIIFYQDISNEMFQSIKHEETELKSLINEITKIMLNQNISSLSIILKKLFAYLETLGLATNHLYVKCIQIYSSIVSEIKKEHILISVPTEDEFYKAIYKSTTFSMMTQVIEKQFVCILNRIKKYNQNSSRHELIIKIKEYIRNYNHSDLSLDHLSSIFFINSSYLSKIFKEECQVNITEYIQNIRIDNAKRLLSSGNSKVKEIAAQVGYADYRYFCTVFKKVTGLTPLQYRIRQM